jgi:ArsR family transcriptional regulator
MSKSERRSEGIVDGEPPAEACLDDYPIAPRRLSESDTVAVAKALAHPTRLEILELFHIRCPRTVGDITAELPLAQSTISNHLRILRDADVVRTLRSDIRAWHCLNRSVLAGFAEAVTTLTRTTHVT